MDYFWSHQKEIKRKGFGNQTLSSFEFEPIAYVSSPFKEKFGVPRQPTLAPGIKAKLKFRPDVDLARALTGLELFSHVWIIFVFHESGSKKWKPTIRPPRLGGRTKMGVLASRSPHRPNPIGLSVGKIESLNLDTNDGPELWISGLDMIDGTPVLDIKPYIPYADRMDEATAGWASEEVKRYPVTLSDSARRSLTKMDSNLRDDFEKALFEMMEIDPRPAFQKRRFPVGNSNSEGLTYGIEILGHEVNYRLTKEGFDIEKIELAPLE